MAERIESIDTVSRQTPSGREVTFRIEPSETAADSVELVLRPEHEDADAEFDLSSRVGPLRQGLVMADIPESLFASLMAHYDASAAAVEARDITSLLSNANHVAITFGDDDTEVSDG